MSWFEEKEDQLIIQIRVIPRAASNAIQGVHGETLKIRLQAPPVDGKANQSLIRFLAKEWHVSRAHIKILSGETGRNKKIILHSPNADLKKLLLSYN